MATEVAMPKLGLLMTEGVVVRWLTANGQPVEKGRPIVSIMTKKITYQVVAPADGILYHAAQVNDKVLIGEPLAFIAAPGEPAPPPPRRTGLTASGEMSGAPAPRPAARRFVPASPWARRLARELEVELADVQGTGPAGCVVGRDVLRAHVERQPPAQPPSPAERPGTARILPFTGMRRVIAERMAESLHTMAQATLYAEVDLTRLLGLRKQAHLRPAPTHTDLVIKAVATALKKHPQLNAILLGDEIELLQDIHIGLAVPLKDGLLVPVIRNADRRTVTQIAQETRRLVRAARAGTLTVDEVAGSTFTITDLGAYGVDFFVPIINPPEAAILGLGRLVKKTVTLQGQAASRFVMMLCLAFDHRVVDGVPAAAFLRTVSRLLRRPQGWFA